MDQIKHLDFKKTAEKNQKGYTLLFEIENILRFFIVDTLSKKNSSWWKDFNKSSVIEQTEINIKAECNKKLLREKKLDGSRFVLMHEIYYTNIMHLYTIIKEYWDNFFTYFGGDSDKEFFHRLEIAHRIRNKVMHSKPIADDELSNLKSLLSFLKNTINKSGNKYNQFLKCYDYDALINDFRHELSKHLTQYGRRNLTEFPDLVYNNAIKEWWWYSEVLDIKTEDLDSYYHKMGKINQLITDKKRGSSTEIKIKIAAWKMKEVCMSLLDDFNDITK